MTPAEIAAAVEARLDGYRAELLHATLMPKGRADRTARVSELAWVLRLIEGIEVAR